MYAITHQTESWLRVVQFSFIVLSTSLLDGKTTRAAEISWTGNAGNGQFFHGGNWSPAGIPQNDDIIHIGNLPGTAGETIMMGAGSAVLHDGLTLSNGITLDMNGSELVSFDMVSVYGVNTRLIARPAPFLNQSDFTGELQLGVGAHFELRDNVLTTLFSPSKSSGTISGRGRMITNAFNNNGIIQPGNNGGLILDAGYVAQDLTVDLDGSLGSGSLQLTTPFSRLQVNAGSLTDAFNNTIAMAPGALLEMNINDGWHSALNSLITVSGFNNPAASQIAGSPLTFGGTMNVGSAQGYLQVHSPTTFTPTAAINVGHTDKLELNGNTLVQGGTFTMGQFAELQFDGPTTLSGGTLSSFASNYSDGTVAFNGPTTWNGNVVLNGSARQQGDATVSGGLGAVINANLFDMDGLSGNTEWNVNSNLVVNADQIGTTSANRFAGTMNIAGGALARATINLTDPTAAWMMSGEMNLSGSSHLFQSRVGGADMIVQGDLNVTGGRVRIDADTTFSDSYFAGPAQVHIGPADSALRMHGETTVQRDVEFSGDGTLVNALSGFMLFEDGVALNTIDFRNDGLFQIDSLAGVASVNRFENGAQGTWSVGIGGLLAGSEHDLLIVGGDAALLDGFLSVDLLSDGLGTYLPSIGDTFTILASLGGVTGTFLNNPVSDFSGQQFHWSVLYNPNDVTLQLAAISVPEPTAGAFAAAIGLAVVLRRSRRSRAACGDLPLQGTPRLAQIGSVRIASIALRFLRSKAIVYVFAGMMVTFLWASAVHAQVVEWKDGNGVWSNPNRWDPVGVPTATDHVILASGSDSDVLLNQSAEIASLEIGTATKLDTLTNQLKVNGDTLVTGTGPGVTHSTLRVGPRDGNSLITEKLTVANGASVEFNGVARINDRFTIQDASDVSGTGIVDLYRTGTSLVNDGEIAAGTNAGLSFKQINGGDFDLDGTSGNGRIRLDEYDEINNWGAKLRFEGTSLTDSFSGRLSLGAGSHLTMNLTDGWSVDSGGEIFAYWNPDTVTPARISGGALDFSGRLSLLGTDGMVASDLEIGSSQIRIRDAAQVDTSSHNVLVFGTNDTSLVRVDGGTFTVGEYSKILFDAPTDLYGGTFHTVSNNDADGSVWFGADTDWKGNVAINGVGRQIGHATVSAQTVIDAQRFDMDGSATTQWDINAPFVLNSSYFGLFPGDSFDGTLNIDGGFVARMTVNLSGAEQQAWSIGNEGTLNLHGNNILFVDRLAGSPVIQFGKTNVSDSKVQISAGMIVMPGSETNFEAPTSQLRMRGETYVREGAVFNGSGSLINGKDGKMWLFDETNLADVGLLNQGELRFRKFGSSQGAAIASVDRFESDEDAILHIRLGGYALGDDYDHLLVTGGPTVLDGRLEVDLLEGDGDLFSPNIGDQFTILSSLVPISGEFLNQPTTYTASNIYHWGVQYDPHMVKVYLQSITSIPEPSAVMLSILGTLLLPSRRRNA